jgi:uncharacterized coiled-coil DUF342 family protein
MIKETGEDRNRRLETYKAQRDRLVAELDSYRGGGSTTTRTGKERANTTGETIAKLEREISQLEAMIAQLEIEFGKG